MIRFILKYIIRPISQVSGEAGALAPSLPPKGSIFERFVKALIDFFVWFFTEALMLKRGIIRPKGEGFLWR